MESLPFIPASEVQAHLEMLPLIDVCQESLVKFSERDGSVDQPVRSVVTAEEGGFMATMPAYVSGGNGKGGMGVKMVSFYPENVARHGVASHHAVIMLFAPETGLPLALMDGCVLTEWRTAACSAAFARAALKADTQRDESARLTLAMVGSGHQADSHLHAISTIQQLGEVRVWSRTQANAQKWADRFDSQDQSTVVRERYGAVRACETVEAAVTGADIIILVTSATTPVLMGEWVKPGAVVVGVGACRPDLREMDDAVMGGEVYVDSKEGAMTESGDVILSKASIHGEVGDLCAGKVASDPSKVRVFKSLGMAVEDVFCAQWVYSAIQSAKAQS